MSPMKIVGVLVPFGLIICLFLTPSVFSQTPEQRTDCSRLFEVEWTQFEGETVDKVTGTVWGARASMTASRAKTGS
jgi:hypothetical protein